MLRRCFAVACTVVAVHAIGAPADSPVKVTVRVPRASGAWVTLMPLTAGGVATTLALREPAEEAALAVPPNTRALLCAGGRDVATQCRVIRTPAKTTETFALDAGRRVSGRCRIGRNAAHARIQVLLDGLETRRPYAIPLSYRNGRAVTAVSTDDDGSFSIEHLAPGDYRFEIRADGGAIHVVDPIHVPALRRGEPATALVRLPPIVFSPGAALDVEARDSNAAVEARVALRQPASEGKEAVVIETATDRRGVVHLTGVDPGRPADLTCLAPGHVRLVQHLDTVPSAVICTLQKFAGIAGAVEDEQGAAVVAASVVAGQRHTTTDDRGRYRLTELPPGPIEVRIAAPGFRAKSLQLSVAEAEEQDVETVRLRAGDVIRGRVVDQENGTAIAGATVAAVAPFAAPMATTNDDGGFQLTADATGMQTFEIRAAGYATRREDLTAEQLQGVLTFPLMRPGMLEVSAWDEERDVPCGGCTVDVSKRGVGRTAATDAEGSVRFEDLEPGDYLVTRERIQATATYVTVSGGDGVMASVKPRSLTHVQLGKRTISTRIAFAPPPSPAWSLRASSGGAVSMTSQDGTGVYVVRRSSGADCLLALLLGDSGAMVGRVPADFHGDTWNAPLPSASLRAVISDSGAPLANVRVTVSASGDLTAWGRSDERGVVVIPFLSAGTYRVTMASRSMDVVVGTSPVTDLGTIDVATPSKSPGGVPQENVQR